MVIKWIKRHLPTAEKIKKLPLMGRINGWFKHRPYLWKFTKHSVAGSLAISVFVAFLPVPLEALIITLLAILFRVNLPIAFLSIWITSPFTLIPANYFSYKVGAWILRSNGVYLPMKRLEFHWNNLSLTWHEFSAWFASLGKAYAVGLPIVSIGTALFTYGLVYSIWILCEVIKNK